MAHKTEILKPDDEFPVENPDTKSGEQEPEIGEPEIEKQISGIIGKDKNAEFYRTQFQYLQADFDNYKKRADKDRANLIKFANAELIKKLLNVLDEFEAAFNLMGKAGKPESVEGFEMIYKNLIKILEGEGLKPIDAAGRKFDHNYHEALMCEYSDKEDGIILEEFQRGYMLGDRVIRHSKVKVARNEQTCEPTGEPMSQ